jgi:hypothetical protein
MHGAGMLGVVEVVEGMGRTAGGGAVNVCGGRALYSRSAGGHATYVESAGCYTTRVLQYLAS